MGYCGRVYTGQQFHTTENTVTFRVVRTLLPRLFCPFLLVFPFLRIDEETNSLSLARLSVNMDEALCSILCSEEDWYWDWDGRSIRFNADGTGEVCMLLKIALGLITNVQKLQCRSNLSYWILAEFEWRTIQRQDSASSQIPAGPAPTVSAKNRAGQPQLLGRLDLEITLTKKLARRARAHPWAEMHPENAANMNGFLADDACRPKSYAVRIERGNFIQPSYIGSQNLDIQRYSLRLLFDRSPYPPRSEWKDSQRGPDDGRFWEHVEFVGRAAPDSARRQIPMNDPSVSSWNSCAVS